MNFFAFLVYFLSFILVSTVVRYLEGYLAFRKGDQTPINNGRVTMNPSAHIDPIGTILLSVAAFVAGVPVIGWMKPLPIEEANFKHPAKDRALVSLAGLSAYLAFALIAFAIVQFVNLFNLQIAGMLNGIASEGGRAFLMVVINRFIWAFQLFFLVNIVLFLFNLVPLEPLEGKWIVSGLLKGNARAKFENFQRIGGVIIVFLILFGVFAAFSRYGAMITHFFFKNIVIYR